MPSFRLPHAVVIFLIGAILALVIVLPGQAQDNPNDQMLQEGAQLYAENCAVCHGVDGKGRIGATLAKDWPSIRPDLRVEETIRNGIAGSPMPAWSQANGGPLNDQQIQALAFFILSWQTGGPPVFAPVPTALQRPVLTPPPEVTGDPNQGAILYDQNCAMCHGLYGQGRIGAVLAKNWPSIRPDLRVKATIENGVAGSPMPAWSQQNGGPLSETDIDNLVAFVLTLRPNPSAGTPGLAGTQQAPGGAPINQQTWVILALVAAVLIAGGVYFALRQKE